MNGRDINYDENQAATELDPTLTVTDPDDTDLEGARVTLTGFVAGQDVLASSTPAAHHRQLQRRATC